MNYLLEKMSGGVHALASSIPSQRERLICAYEGACHILFDDDWGLEDEDLTSMLARLRDAALLVTNSEIGNIRASVDKMDENQVQECVDLWLRIYSLLNERPVNT